MEKIHNFNAGPCLLPDEVYQLAAQAILNFNNSGVSILSISHRSEEFINILEETRKMSLELLGLQNKAYSALFLQGGASMEFLRVPFNLLTTKAGYINTGNWSLKAIEQAKIFGQAKILASSEDKNFSYIPDNFEISERLDYVHFTSNNTIYGTQFQKIPQTDNVLVCDMSSDIYSRVFDCDKIDLIYAGVQKNIGAAGLSLVVIREEILGNTNRVIPAMMDYQEHLNKNSLYHTANVFGVYTCFLNLKWLKRQGGVEAIEKLNNKKAALLYQTIDSLDFVYGTAVEESRSKMNATFYFEKPEMNKIFDDLCLEANIVNIKGHRTVGGYRASLYNALPLESVKVLTDVLNQMKLIV